jgi:hypothetical protein
MRWDRLHDMRFRDVGRGFGLLVFSNPVLESQTMGTNVGGELGFASGITGYLCGNKKDEDFLRRKCRFLVGSINSIGSTIAITS